MTTQAALSFVQHLAHGIRVTDTGFHRPMSDVSDLIVEGSRAAFVRARLDLVAVLV